MNAKEAVNKIELVASEYVDELLSQSITYDDAKKKIQSDLFSISSSYTTEYFKNYCFKRINQIALKNKVDFSN